MPAATTTAPSPKTHPPGPASTISLHANKKKKARSPGPKATAGSPAASSNASAKTSARIKWSAASPPRQRSLPPQKLAPSPSPPPTHNSKPTSSSSPRQHSSLPTSSKISRRSKRSTISSTPLGSPPISHSITSPIPAVPSPPGTPSSSTRQRSATSMPHTNPSAPTSTKPSGRFIGR